MSDEKKTLVEDILCNPFGFRVEWKYSEHWADVTVWEITARGCEKENTPYFNSKGWTAAGDSDSHEEAERYLVGYIKWDGCSEFTFSPDEEDGSDFHWCGPNDYKKHFSLLESLYKRSRELIAASADWANWN